MGRWVLTNTYKNCTRKSKVIYFASSSVFDVGNFVILLPSIELPDPHDRTKLEDWGTEPSKDTSSTEFVCAVVAVRSPYQRVLLMVNQEMKESRRSNSREESAPKLRSELVDWLEHFEC